MGSDLLSSLGSELRGLGATRIDTSVHFNNSEAKRYYEGNGFQALNEERLSLLLRHEDPNIPSGRIGPQEERR